MRLTKMQLRQRIKLKEGCPLIDQRLMRGGMQSRNLRKEIKSYKTDLQRYEDNEILTKPVLKDIKFASLFS